MTTQYSGTEMVDIAKNIERSGELFYEAARKRLSDPEVKKLFAFLRDEERRHAETFERLLGPTEQPDGFWRADDDYLGYMRTLAEGQIFPDEAAVARLVATLKGAEDAIETALSFERDTILFFHEMRDGVREDSRDLVDRLVAEERSHIRTLHRMRKKLREKAEQA